MGEESEYECTPRFFVGDFHITTKDVGSCEGGETSFDHNQKKIINQIYSHLLSLIMKKKKKMPRHLGVKARIWWKSIPP